MRHFQCFFSYYARRGGDTVLCQGKARKQTTDDSDVMHRLLQSAPIVKTTDDTKATLH